VVVNHDDKPASRHLMGPDPKLRAPNKQVLIV
jgi:hypothetical protein